MGSLIQQHKLPTIDFTKGIPNSLNKAKNEVVSALEEYGCFIAIYDRVSLELHYSLFDALKELFDLPTEIKMQNKSTKPSYGYVGQIPFIPLYESMGIDAANTPEGTKGFTKVMWPEGNNNFSETLVSYSKVVAELEHMVVKTVFETYGVEKYYYSYADSASYLCRAIKYRAAEANESNMGVSSHTDKGFMTIIYQNQICGLEIKAKDGQWFGVDDLSPSSFVVMAGDAILAWSNGRIHSPHHGVTMNSKNARYTVAQFSFMRDEVKAPDELVDDENPLQFKPFDHIEYLSFYSKPENKKLESCIRTCREKIEY